MFSNAVITGACGGLGQALARQLLAQGAAVALLGLDRARRAAAGAELIVLPRRTGWLASALSLLPASMHDRLLLRQPRKPRVGEAGATAIPGLDTDRTR